MADLVSLFRCKRCRARMFERDCVGHLQRHGLTVDAKKIRTHFTEETGAISGQAGAQVAPIHYTKRKRGPRPATAVAVTSDDDPELES